MNKKKPREPKMTLFWPSEERSVSHTDDIELVNANEM